MIRVMLAVVMAVAPQMAYAGCNQAVCAPRVVQRVVHAPAVVKHAVVQQAVVAQAVVANAYDYNQAVLLNQVNPAQYYTVGAYVQEEAIAKRLTDRIERLVEKRLNEALQAREKTEQASGRTEHPGLELARKTCASCHRDGSMKVTDKGAPKLFDALDNWIGTPAQNEKAVLSVEQGRMPPAPQQVLTDRDFVVFKDYLESLSQPNRND